MPDKFDSGMRLWDTLGRRKYLTLIERVRFMKASTTAEPKTKLFCMVLALTGARISEVLALTPQQVDAGACCIVFRTLKRRCLVFRSVPVPSRLMRDLVTLTWAMQRDEPIWPWCRQTAWQRVKDVMATAEVVGKHASPKGLRHGFGIEAAERNVPLSLIARWLGHKNTQTTAIYLEALGQEERRFAKRLWHDYARL